MLTLYASMYTVYNKHYIAHPLDKAWDFFANPYNAIITSPPSLLTDVDDSAPSQVTDGHEFNYKINIFPVLSSEVKTMIIQFQQKRRIVRQQVAGPFKHWQFELEFLDNGKDVEVHEKITYLPPYGKFGEFLDPVFIRPQIKKYLRYRSEKINKLFG